MDTTRAAPMSEWLAPPVNFRRPFGAEGQFRDLLSVPEIALGVRFRQVPGFGDVDRVFDYEVHVVGAQIDPAAFLQLVQTIVNLITHLVLDVGF